MKVVGDMNLGRVHADPGPSPAIHCWGKGGVLVTEDIRPDAGCLHMQI